MTSHGLVRLPEKLGASGFGLIIVVFLALPARVEHELSLRKSQLLLRPSLSLQIFALSEECLKLGLHIHLFQAGLFILLPCLVLVLG